MRTGSIAIVLGAVVAQRLHQLAYLPVAALCMLWPSLGGHFVELWFLNFLRPRLPFIRALQAGMRLAVWFLGGIGLALAMRLTVMALTNPPIVHWPAWWLGGLFFIGLELLVHLVLHLRGRPNFYTGRG